MIAQCTSQAKGPIAGGIGRQLAHFREQLAHRLALEALEISARNLLLQKVLEFLLERFFLLRPRSSPPGTAELKQWLNILQTSGGWQWQVWLGHRQWRHWTKTGVAKHGLKLGAHGRKVRFGGLQVDGREVLRSEQVVAEERADRGVVHPSLSQRGG